MKQKPKKKHLLPRPWGTVTCCYRGFDPELDRKLEKLAKGPRTGSGTHLADNIRDIDFMFTTVARALIAAKRIKTARLRGVRVAVTGCWAP